MSLFTNFFSKCPDVCRIRLSEGFNFAASGEGIINMVIELPMKVKSSRTNCSPKVILCDPDLVLCLQGTSGDVDRESHSCIVQYILFPPHSTSTKDR